MSILSALKTQEGSIRELAMLPQQQILSMAQMGQLDVSMVPVILNEKAQMVQQAANMQAMAQGTPPSVIEQAMAINAQADAANAPPAGLEALPVPDDMYSEQSMAGGGIVAFSKGGSQYDRLADAYGGGDPYGRQMNPGSGASLSDFFRMMQGFQEPESEEERRMREYFARAGERATTRKEDLKNEFLLNAGLRMLGTSSPYFLQSLGKAGSESMAEYRTGMKEAQAEEMASMRAAADAAARARAEKMAMLSPAATMYGAAQDRAFRQEEGELNRKNQIAIANIPPKELQVAAQIRKENPGTSFLDSVSQAAQAMAPKDTYNATRTAVSAAARDANTEFTQRLTFDPKLQDDMKKAAAGDKEAEKRVNAVRDAIQKRVFEAYQVEGVNLSSGKMGGAGGASDPLGIRR